MLWPKQRSDNNIRTDLESENCN